MRGAIRYRQGRYDDALINFDRAIERDDGYFVYYLSRGLTHSRKGARSLAKADLSQSVRLLPTATAYQALGQLAEEEGDIETAKRYYAQAGQDSGAAGQTALASFTRLDLPTQPAKYIQARVGLDARNRYVVQVVNQARLPVQEVVLRVEVQTVAGTRSSTQRINYIGAGETVMAVLKIDPAAVQQARAYPVAAAVAQ